MISIQNVTKNYGRKVAVDNLALNIDRRLTEMWQEMLRKGKGGES